MPVPAVTRNQVGRMIDRLVSVVLNSAREVVEREGTELPEELGPETRLFGHGGVFDSLGLVSLIVGVEEAIADAFGITVSLADERAMSQANSPFRTVRTLAEYAASELEASDVRSA